MAQQTAVDYIIGSLRQLAFNENTHLGMGDVRVTQGLIDELEEQAKQMEREQHESTCVEVIEKILDKLEKGENTNSQDVFNQYYNETYGK